MDTRLQNQAKTASPSSVAATQTGLFQARPFTESEQEDGKALDSSHQLPDLQAQLDRASRFGHNFSRVQVQGNSPAGIQLQPDIGQQDEQQDEQEAEGERDFVKLMAPPLGKPIQRESQDEEPIQMMPQLGVFAPVIQRERQDEEPIQMMPQLGLLAPVIQRESQDEEPIQMMPDWGILQRSTQEDDEEPIQMMPQWSSLQRQEAEAEEEPIQMKWVQPKVVVGQPGDKYEQEADSVAAQVMSMSTPPANAGLVQRQGEEDEQESLVQRSPLANSITPLVQRQTEEQEEAIQLKSLLQRVGAKGNNDASSGLENKLANSKGGGSPLPDDVRSFMEPRFGVDFSSVRVHSDSTAVQMNKDLGAQAFAHGSDIYYGAGKSPAQDSLTAHELTHVVQQTGAKKLQAKSLIGLQSNKETLQAKISPATDTAIQLKKAPDSPQADPAFRAVTNKTQKAAQEQKKHPPAKTKSAEAQAAAKPPTNEVESKAQDKQVQEMNQQKPGQFNAAAFKAALNQKIAAIAPQTLEEADNFKDSNQIESVKGEVTSQVTDQKKQASEPIEEKTKEPPNTSGITPKPVTPLPPKKAGAKPGNVGAAGAAPKPKDNSEVSLQEGCQSLDQQMANADVTEEQLQKSNEPEFKSALGAKKTAKTDATKAPQAYRQQERTIVNKAQAQAQTTASTQLEGMHGTKEQAVAKVLGNQTEAKGSDEQKRTEVANRIQGIYNKTKQKVEATLSQLDGEVNTQFDQGAAAAKTLFENYVDQRMKRYKDERYSGPIGWGKWLKDKVLGMPSEVNAFYQEGRTQYLASMDRTIDKIANLVASKLNAAKAEIAKGKQEIQKYVASLPQSLRQVGQEAAQNIQSKFDELEQSVDNKENELIDSLAQKYNDNLQQLDTRIDEMKAENRGLVDKAMDAIGGVIKTILELKNMLMGVLRRAAGAIEQIIKDPIGFLGHLIAGLKQGFLNFKENISQHLKKGFMGFLTGTMASAGIQIPKSFDMKGIFGLVTQVLGMTYEAIRPKAVKRMGEKPVSTLESNFEMFVILKNEGTGGLWKFIQGQIGDLKSMVIDTLQSFIIEKVIVSGITWILSLLNPASAFVRACKAIIDIIMFFIERASQIAELINAIIDAVSAIASGAIGGAAKAIENALSKSLPVVISFMASLLGIGGISNKVQEVIKRVRQPIEKAIDWVIEQAMKFAKKIGNKLGFGKGKKNKDNKSEEGEGASEKDHPRLAAQAIAELKKIDGAPKDYKTLRQQKEAQSKQIEQDYTAKLKPGIKLSVRFDDVAKDEQDGDIDFEVVIAPNTTRKKAVIPAKTVQHQIILGKRDRNGQIRQQVSQTGTMEDLLLKLRSEQLGKTEITAKDILQKCNYAMSNIRIQGVTKAGLTIESTFPITNDQLLSIFSSGKGMVAGERVKLRVVEAAPGGQGTVKILREAEMEPEIAEIAPELYIAPGAQIVVSQEDELKQFLETKLGPTINRDGYIAQLDKHSEQAIWQAIRTNDKQIAAMIRERDIHRITHLSVNIHSERQMCPVCAAASNYMIANLATEAPEIWGALQEKKATQLGLETNVTSTVPFRGSAPQAPDGTDSTTKAAPPTGHTRPQQEVTPERATQLTQPLTTTIEPEGGRE